jgi:aspartyl/asparaginyl-tRNA synthetase
VLSDCAEDMNSSQRASIRRHRKSLEDRRCSHFVRLTYTEASNLLTSRGEKFEFPVSWGHDLQAEHERYLTEKKFQRPVILFDYPRHDQAVLHARQRRRKDGAGNGRAGARWARSSAAASAKSGSTC